MGRRRVDEEMQLFNDTVGRRIMLLRKMRRMSAVDLAAAVGIKSSRLYWYESGRTSCPALILSKIAKHLHVPVTYLMVETYAKNE